MHAAAVEEGITGGDAALQFRETTPPKLYPWSRSRTAGSQARRGWRPGRMPRTQLDAKVCHDPTRTGPIDKSARSHALTNPVPIARSVSNKARPSKDAARTRLSAGWRRQPSRTPVLG